MNTRGHVSTYSTTLYLIDYIYINITVHT